MTIEKLCALMLLWFLNSIIGIPAMNTLFEESIDKDQVTQWLLLKVVKILLIVGSWILLTLPYK